MVTETQQKIYDELSKYADLEQARNEAKKISVNVGCSETYVRRMIGRKESESSTVKFKIPPKEPEPEETPEEVESDEAEDYEDSEYQPDEDALEAPAPDDWEFDAQDEDPEEPETDVVREISDMDLTDIISRENCAVLISTPFRMAADWTEFEGWALTEKEEKQLSPMVRALLLKYLPTIMAEYFAEIVFAVVIIQVISIKAKSFKEFQEEQNKTLIAQKQAEEREREAQQPPPDVETEIPKELTKDSTTPHWMAKDGRIMN